MAEPQRTSMTDILSDAPAKPQEAPPAAEAKADIPVLGDGSNDPKAPEKPQVEQNQSRRKAHLDKERTARADGERARGEDGKFTKAEEKKEEKAPEEKAAPAAAAKPAQQPEFTERERAFLRGLEEERRKRQALESEVAKLKPSEDKKTFWDDPEKAIQTMRQETQQQIMNARLQMSEAMARDRHKDFDDAVGVFSELVHSTPGLAQQWLGNPDPAEFAYQTGKAHKELKEAGGIKELREKIERETRVKMEAELRDKEAAIRAEMAKIPPSLSNATGATTQQRTQFMGPTPMSDILKH